MTRGEVVTDTLNWGSEKISPRPEWQEANHTKVEEEESILGPGTARSKTWRLQGERAWRKVSQACCKVEPDTCVGDEALSYDLWGLGKAAWMLF